MFERAAFDLNTFLVHVDYALARVREELVRAKTKFPAHFHSPHEGYGILLEEVNEMWDEVKANNSLAAGQEAMQVAAMAVQFMIDIGRIGARASENRDGE